MKITLNGESRTVEANATLADFIASLGEQPQALATAVNGEFVPREWRAQLPLHEGDVVFTFQPITGG